MMGSTTSPTHPLARQRCGACGRGRLRWWSAGDFAADQIAGLAPADAAFLMKIITRYGYDDSDCAFVWQCERCAELGLSVFGGLSGARLA